MSTSDDQAVAVGHSVGPTGWQVRLEEPVLVLMSEAERSATVAALAEIIAAWWMKQLAADRSPIASSGGADEPH